jgi:(1->4)-alpha-D-glucan 1-alpha-D-glucosylmutase
VLNRRHKSLVNDAPAPDNNEEYLFYQTLVGAWPTDCLTDAVLEPGAMDALAERLGAYMLKAAREAKAHSSWINQDVAYEEAVLAFVRQSGGARYLPGLRAMGSEPGRSRQSPSRRL